MHRLCLGLAEFGLARVDSDLRLSVSSHLHDILLHKRTVFISLRTELDQDQLLDLPNIQWRPGEALLNWFRQIFGLAHPRQLAIISAPEQDIS